MAIAELYRETENVKYVGVRVQCTSSVWTLNTIEHFRPKSSHQGFIKNEILFQNGLNVTSIKLNQAPNMSICENKRVFFYGFHTTV